MVSAAQIYRNAALETNAMKKKSPFWLIPGKFKGVNPQGGTVINLRHGIFRLEYPNGSKYISGLKLKGYPLLGFLNQNGEEEWSLDASQIIHNMEKDIPEESELPQPKISYAEVNGTAYELLEYTLGLKLRKLIIIRFQEESLRIVSEFFLAGEELHNFLRTVSELPPPTFKYPLYYMIDLKEIKESISKRGLVKWNACMVPYENSIFLERSCLQNIHYTRAVLYHETGHVSDCKKAVRSSISVKLLDEKGEKLFGSGKRLIIDENGKIELGKSDYFSRYAAANELEDFAETHRILVKLRTVFNSVNPGEDLFALPEVIRDEFLQTRGFTTVQLKKILAVYKIVYANFNPDADPKILLKEAVEDKPVVVRMGFGLWQLLHPKHFLSLSKSINIERQKCDMDFPGIKFVRDKLLNANIYEIAVEEKSVVCGNLRIPNISKNSLAFSFSLLPFWFTGFDCCVENLCKDFIQLAVKSIACQIGNVIQSWRL